MFLKVVAGVVLTLTDTGAFVAVPGAALIDDVKVRTDVKEFAFVGDAFPVKDVKTGFLKGRRHLIFHNLHAGFGTVDFFALFQRVLAADIDTHGAVELQGIAARRDFGAAVSDADLHTDLVNEDHKGLCLRDRSGELTQSLTHQTGLQAGKRFTHIAFDFASRR